MIELRWLQDSDFTVKLQYRAQVLQMHKKPMGQTDDGKLIMCEVPTGYGWSEWQDVPTVKE